MSWRSDETHAQLLTRAADAPLSLDDGDRQRLGDDVELVAESLGFYADLIAEHLAARREKRRPRLLIPGARQFEILRLARAGQLNLARLELHELRAIDIDTRFSRALDVALGAAS